MANKRIERKDLVAPNAITSITKETQILVTELEKLLVAQKAILKNNAFKNAADVKAHNKVTQEANATTKALLSTRKKLEQSRTLEAQALTQTKVQLQEQNKANKLLAREKLGLISAYEKEARTLNELRKKYKDVALSMGENSKQARKLKAEVTKLDSKLKKVDKSAGQFQRNVGNYPKVFSGAAASIGAAFLSVTALVRVFGDAIKRTREFEQTNANLASVLGTTSDNIKELTNDAKRLGAETSFSASQVSKLQTEFAKLGFNKQEILNATEATLSLAAATGTDLSEAAAVAGATMGGFGLDAKETQRVVDVMAKSFSTSALDMEKFRESMKDAAPAAKAVGVDIERTTALLGSLANAGISGSKAGTALKAGFIELNAAGIDLDEGLLQIVNSQNKLETATALVGKRAATSFLVLADGVDTTKELEEGLNNAGGAAKKMADTQLDTLSGSIKILDSAWEGLVLGLLEGDGAFSDLSRSIVSAATSMLTFFTNTELASDAMKKEQIEIQNTVLQISESNLKNEDRVKLIQELKDKYPEYLKSIDSDKVSNQELAIAIKDVNKGLIDKIILQEEDEKVAEKQAEVIEKGVALERKKNEVRAQLVSVAKQHNLEILKEGDLIDKSINLQKQLETVTNDKGQGFNEQRKAVLIQMRGLIRAQTEFNEAELEGNDLINTRDQLANKLGLSIGDEPKSVSSNEPEKPNTDKILKEEKAKKQTRDDIAKRLVKEDSESDALSIEFDADSQSMAGFDEAIANQRKKQEEEAKKSAEKAAQDQIDADLKAADEQRKIAEQLAKDKEALRKEQIETIEKGVNAVSDAMSRASEKRLAGFDRETEENAKALDRQERRAEQGLENNAAALQAQQDKLEAQKVREQEEQERRQKILAYFNLAAEYAKDDANTAPFKALATIGVMEAVTALFEQGTDKGVEADMSGSKVRNTGKDDYLGRTKSGKAFLFDGREKIMGIQHSAALTDYTNQQIVDIVQNSERGGLTASIALNDSRIVSRLDSLEKAVQNSKVSLHIDENAFVTHTQFRNGMKKVSKSKPKRLF